MEEAYAYSRLKRVSADPKMEIAFRVNMNRPFIANSMQLLQLPKKIQDLLSREVECGAWKVLLGVSERKQQ